MQIYVIVGLACIVAQAVAQNYGPLPPRPQFPGASLVQGPPPRQNLRSRGSARAIQEPIQQVPVPIDQPNTPQRIRRPQPIARARAQFVQSPLYDQQRNSIIEDVPPIQYKPKIALPTPLVPFQPSPQISPHPIQPLAQQAQTPKLLTPRPVIEDEVNEASEEEAAPTPATTPSTTTAFTASVRPPSFQQPVLQPSPIPVVYQRPQFALGNGLRPQTSPPQPVGFPEAASLQARQLIRPQVRPPPEQTQIPIVRPTPQALKPKEEIGEEPQYFRQSVRPLKKQEPIPRQQIIEQDQLRGREPVRQIIRQQQQQPIRQQQQELAVQRPVQREPHVKASSHQREKKPVVQTIRKFHEEHEDGSITWGYENDDGSFKEETIGVDCVTRGKYGYYDPDGVKREYTYQTGIPCDRQAQEAEEAESQHEGYIDYTNNKYVLPNGDEIDLEAMVKNRARKPVQRYRN